LRVEAYNILVIDSQLAIPAGTILLGGRAAAHVDAGSQPLPLICTQRHAVVRTQLAAGALVPRVSGLVALASPGRTQGRTTPRATPTNWFLDV
jgi:hypothetical protein